MVDIHKKAIESLERCGYKELVEDVYHKVLDSFEAYIEINLETSQVDITYFDSDEVEREWFILPGRSENIDPFLIKLEELVHNRCNRNKLK